MAAVDRARRAGKPQQRSQSGALLGVAAGRSAGPAAAAGRVRPVLTGPQRRPRRSDAALGVGGGRGDARQWLDSRRAGDRRRQPGRATAGAQCHRTAGPGPRGPRRPDHGHPAAGGRHRRRTGAHVHRLRHADRPDQLRPRRRDGVEGHGRQRQNRGRRRRTAVPGGDGPRRTQAAHRPAAARTAGGAAAAEPQRARSGRGGRAGLADQRAPAGPPARARVDHGAGRRRLAGPPRRRRRTDVARHPRLQTAAAARRGGPRRVHRHHREDHLSRNRHRAGRHRRAGAERLGDQERRARRHRGRRTARRRAEHPAHRRRRAAPDPGLQPGAGRGRRAAPDRLHAAGGVRHRRGR